jgi:predicted DNA-binding protein
MVKMTFTIDLTTAETLKRIANRLQKSQSFVLREAITHYEPHAGQLSKAERKRRVELFDQVITSIRKKPASAVVTELKQLRTSRRKGWRRASHR